MAKKILAFTKKDREKVKKLAGYGLRDEDIANIFDLAESTIKHHFKNELAKGRSNAFDKVAKTAFNMAKSGECPTMTIFWLKTRGHGQFKETQFTKDETPEDSTPQIDLKKLSKDERAKLKELLKKAHTA